MKFSTDLYARYKILVKPIIIIFSSVAVLLLVIIPQILSFFNVDQKIKLAVSQAQTLKVRAADLEQIDEGFYTKNLQVIYSILPKSQEIPSAFLALQTLLAQNNLVLDSAQVLNSSKANQHSFEITLTVLGSRPSIKNFISSLNTSPRLFEFNNIDLQSIRAGVSTQAQVQLTVYYDPTTTPQVDVTQDIPKLSADDQKLLSSLSERVATNQTTSGENVVVPSGKADPLE